MENNLEEKPIKSVKFKKRLKIAIAIAIILVAFFVIWVLTLPPPKGSQEEWLSQFSAEDLEKLNSLSHADIPTRTTPEQTYAALKDALKNEDVEKAAECFTEEKRGEWGEVFTKAKETGAIKEILNELPEEMTQGDKYDTRAYYSIPQEIDGKIFEHSISFVKDSTGDWKIENF